jgi:hypothetical protein
MGDHQNSSRTKRQKALAALTEGTAMRADFAQRFNVPEVRFGVGDMSKAREQQAAGGKIYYRARGFGTYYFSNVISNIVADPFSYIRGIEDIFGDAKTAWFAEPFKTYTNLHEFIRCIASEILLEDMNDFDADLSFLSEFLARYKVPLSAENAEDRDSLWEKLGELHEFDDALEELTDEIFHVLFNDVRFLGKFNNLVASYIENAELEPDLVPYVTQKGTLRRVSIPQWARKAVYFRDRGECRVCKRTLAMTVNQTEFERYDHIIPLAGHGANDVTNLQLLCEACNQKKSASIEPVSDLYLRALQRR